MKTLTPKQLKFVSEYLEGGNKSAAYRLAYNCQKMSDKTIRRKAQEVAVLPHVASEIERYREDLRAVSMVTAERVLQEIGSIAFSDFTEFVELSEGRYRVRNLEDLTREQRAAIKSIRPVQTSDGSHFEIELHDKMGALRQLAKSLGLDKVKPPTEAHQVHIHLDMRGDGPVDIRSNAIDVTPVRDAVEGSHGLLR
jgi:phage terminase small subunit